MSKTRIEKDSMGELHVPADALYAAQTQRAVNNFPVSGQPLPAPFIRALLLAKRAAATANGALEQIPSDMADAIRKAVDDLIDSDFMQHFPVDVYQTGSGTSSNMNANEVLATLATRIYGNHVGANDHINAGQSSNDIIPSTIHISAAIELEQQLLPALTHLMETTRKKAEQVDQYVKTGRTHLMDAMPVRMSQSLNAWADQIEHNITHLKQLQPSIHSLALGGTAVGTGINPHPDFAAVFAQCLSEHIGITFTPARNFFTHIGSQDIAVAVSGQLKTTAVSIMKIANDLRWMNSGPLAGLGEIELQALQPGSSIMPGKVNPTQAEAMTMVCCQVLGNHTAISIGGSQGNFELNVYKPMMIHNLLHSTRLLADTCRSFSDKCVDGLSANEDAIRSHLENSLMLVTALNNHIGYDSAAKIAKHAHQQGLTLRAAALDLGLLTNDQFDQWVRPNEMIGPKQ